MAEALISWLLEKLASVTYQYVEEEVKLVLNAEKDVKEFADNLEAIGAVLEDAEQRQVKEKRVRKWLEELKDVSYKMDNVLDEWNTEILKLKVEKQEEHCGSTCLVTEMMKAGVKTMLPEINQNHYIEADFARVQKSSKRKSAETGLMHFLFRGNEMERERSLHALVGPVVGCCITDFSIMVFSFAFGENEDHQKRVCRTIFLRKVLSND